MTDDSKTIRVSTDRGVARVTIDHQPLNLLGAELMTELDRYTRAVATDPAVRVLIMDSADDDFFIAHGDMAIVDNPTQFGQLPIATDQPAGWNPMMRLHDRSAACRRSPSESCVARHAAAVDAADDSLEHGLDVENDMLGRLFAEPIAARLTRDALEAGAQTRAGERNLEAVLDVLRRSA